MVYQETKKLQEQTKQIKVTDLTHSQKRQLFIYHIAQAGFKGFNKKQVGKETYYTFIYKNSDT